MKVQCPRCHAAYALDASKIPEQGASAKCKSCGATIPIGKPAALKSRGKVCPRCGRPVDGKATECAACGIELANHRPRTIAEDEALAEDQPFRMSELPEGANAEAGAFDAEMPEQFSSGLGVKVKAAKNTPKWVIGVLFILLVLFAIFRLGGGRSWFGLFGGPVVTMSEYQQVANGMTYRQVSRIIGAPGEETSRSRIDGVSGTMSGMETVSYHWINPDGSNMNAIFQNDKLMSKTQFGLR